MNDTFLERLRDDPIVRILADANPSFMSYVDADYRYQFCNRAYEEFFGKRREDVIGRTVSELWGRQVAEELLGWLSWVPSSWRIAPQHRRAPRRVVSNILRSNRS